MCLNALHQSTNGALRYLTHPDYATLVAPLCYAKRVKNNWFFQTLFPRSEERVVERSNDRVSPILSPCWWGHQQATMQCVVGASLLTHPDYATLVAPLCFAKRVKNNCFFKPPFRAAKRGGASEAMTG
jgi:hypothetical protein